MVKKFQKISKIISEEGISSFLLKSIRYINKYICGILIKTIYELDLEHPDPQTTSELELSFRMATKEDIDSMDEEHYSYGQKGKQYSKERLAKGDTCILAVHNSKIIGYSWTMIDHMELSQFNYIPLPKKRAFGYNSFVLKEYRGKRVGPVMYNYKNDILRKEGKRFVVAIIDINNKPPIKSVERLGYKRIGYIYRFTFFGLKYEYIKKKDLSYLQNP